MVMVALRGAPSSSCPASEGLVDSCSFMMVIWRISSSTVEATRRAMDVLTPLVEVAPNQKGRPESRTTLRASRCPLGACARVIMTRLVSTSSRHPPPGSETTSRCSPERRPWLLARAQAAALLPMGSVSSADSSSMTTQRPLLPTAPCLSVTAEQTCTRQIGGLPPIQTCVCTAKVPHKVNFSGSGSRLRKPPVISPFSRFRRHSSEKVKLS